MYTYKRTTEKTRNQVHTGWKVYEQIGDEFFGYSENKRIGKLNETVQAKNTAQGDQDNGFHIFRRLKDAKWLLSKKDKKDLAILKVEYTDVTYRGRVRWSFEYIYGPPYLLTPCDVAKTMRLVRVYSPRKKNKDLRRVAALD